MKVDAELLASEERVLRAQFETEERVLVLRAFDEARLVLAEARERLAAARLEQERSWAAYEAASDRATELGMVVRERQEASFERLLAQTEIREPTPAEEAADAAEQREERIDRWAADQASEHESRAMEEDTKADVAEWKARRWVRRALQSYEQAKQAYEAQVAADIAADAELMRAFELDEALSDLEPAVRRAARRTPDDPV